MEEDIQTLIKVIRDLQFELSQEREASFELRKEMVESHQKELEKLQEANKEIEWLRKECENHRANWELVHPRDLVMERDNLKFAKEYLEKQLAKSKKRIKELEEKIDEASNGLFRLQELQEENNANIVQSKYFREQYDEAIRRINQLKEEINKLLDSNNRLAERNEELKFELDKRLPFETTTQIDSLMRLKPNEELRRKTSYQRLNQ